MPTSGQLSSQTVRGLRHQEREERTEGTLSLESITSDAAPDATTTTTTTTVTMATTMATVTPQLQEDAHFELLWQRLNLKKRIRKSNSHRFSCFKLDVRDGDWELLHKRGFTWNQFKSVVDECDCVSIGPIVLTYDGLGEDPTYGSHIRFNDSLVVSYKYEHHDRLTRSHRSVMEGLLLLLGNSPPNPKACTPGYLISGLPGSLVVTQPRSSLHLFEMYRCYNISEDLSDWMVQHNRIHMEVCVFDDRGERLCRRLKSSACILESITLYFCNIDATYLADGIEHCQSVRKLFIRSGDGGTDWSILLPKIARSHSLHTIELRGIAPITVCVDGFVALVANDKLRQLSYAIKPYDEDWPIAVDVREAHRQKMLDALRKNLTLTKLELEVGFIRTDFLCDEIEPLLDANRYRTSIVKAAKHIAERWDTQSLAFLLSQSFVRNNPHVLMPFISITFPQIAELFYAASTSPLTVHQQDESEHSGTADIAVTSSPPVEGSNHSKKHKRWHRQMRKHNTKAKTSASDSKPRAVKRRPRSPANKAQRSNAAPDGTVGCKVARKASNPGAARRAQSKNKKRAGFPR